MHKHRFCVIAHTHEWWPPAPPLSIIQFHTLNHVLRKTSGNQQAIHRQTVLDMRTWKNNSSLIACSTQAHHHMSSYQEKNNRPAVLGGSSSGPMWSWWCCVSPDLEAGSLEENLLLYSHPPHSPAMRAYIYLRSVHIWIRINHFGHFLECSWFQAAWEITSWAPLHQA